jgi:voltage-gated potassium channel
MKRAILIIALLLAFTIIGTVGYHAIEEMRWLDALYMAVITITTVGYREVAPLSDAGILFTIVYLMCAVGIFTYSAFQLGQWILSADMLAARQRRRMEQTIAKLTQHFIVCGMGRMGTTICKYLHERKRPFVVIEHDEHVRHLCEERGWAYILGDATSDETLKRAGLGRARSLASVLSTDADNIYVVLAARMLAPQLQIIARASDEGSIPKFERAGANRVISPFSTGAMKLARFMLHPSIEDFLEIADLRGNDLELADVQITEHSPFAGKKLTETDLREQGVMVIGIRRPTGERLMPPPSSAVLQAGDSLFVFGNVAAVNRIISETSGEEPQV